jgi:hypothetical protein
LPTKGQRPFEQTVTTTSLSWWATDDFGTWYLGQLQPSERDAHTTTAVVTFNPPLHRKATTVSLLATTLRTRAVIDVALPTGAGM